MSSSARVTVYEAGGGIREEINISVDQLILSARIDPKGVDTFRAGTYVTMHPITEKEYNRLLKLV